jgi:hypothetical protein
MDNIQKSQLRVCDPESAMVLNPELQPGYPVDAMNCGFQRLKSLLAVLSSQFDGTYEDGARLSDDHITNLIWTAEGQVKMLENLFDHGMAASLKTLG